MAGSSVIAPPKNPWTSSGVKYSERESLGWEEPSRRTSGHLPDPACACFSLVGVWDEVVQRLAKLCPKLPVMNQAAHGPWILVSPLRDLGDLGIEPPIDFVATARDFMRLVATSLPFPLLASPCPPVT